MENTKWVVDQSHSEIQFKAKHLMITTVTGKFTEYEATIETEENDFSKSKISFKANINSISTGNDQRDEHLKSDDFFSADKFPTLNFESTKMEKVSENEFKMTGDFTIRDVTKEVTFDVEFAGIKNDPYGNTKAGFEISGKVNRKDFGLKFHVLNEAGDLLVSDEIKILCEVQLQKEEVAETVEQD